MSDVLHLSSQFMQIIRGHIYSRQRGFVMFVCLRLTAQWETMKTDKNLTKYEEASLCGMIL